MELCGSIAKQMGMCNLPLCHVNPSGNEANCTESLHDLRSPPLHHPLCANIIPQPHVELAFDIFFMLSAHMLISTTVYMLFIT